MNLSDPSIFAEAQEELLGKGHSFPMLAYGTLKLKSAFKMYCRAKDVPPQDANDVSKQIDAYEVALKEASDDEKEAIDISDYVSEQYMEYIRDSEPYRGIVVSRSQAPCAYMIYNGDIESEIGIIRVNANGGKKIVYCTICDGYTAEDFGYIKNDLLAVQTIAISAEAMKRAGLPAYSSKEIIELTRDDEPTWAIFAKGYTQGINQCQGKGTTEKLKIYKPKALKDLSAFVAAIRPGFKSMVDKFLRREHFEYGIPEFDALLKNDTSGSSWLLYQEDIMKVLALAGFSAEEQYPVIKAISKKKVKVISAAEERFLKGFSEYIGGENGNDIAKMVWRVIMDSASYSFNASHSVAVSIDALYGAYLKAHYPYAYYSTLLDTYSSQGKKDQVAEIKAEMYNAFGIRVAPCRFGQDNRTFTVCESRHEISNALSSIKGIGKPVADALYALGQDSYPTFTDLMRACDSYPALGHAMIQTLIRLNYFESFGKRAKLLRIFEEYDSGKNRVTKTLTEKNVFIRMKALRLMEQTIPDEDLSREEIFAYEVDKCGTPVSTIEEASGIYAVLSVNDTYTPKIMLYNISSARVGTVKIRKQLYQQHPLAVGQLMTVHNSEKRPVYTFGGDKPKIVPGVMDIWITSYDVSPLPQST